MDFRSKEWQLKLILTPNSNYRALGGAHSPAKDCPVLFFAVYRNRNGKLRIILKIPLLQKT